MNCQRKGCLNVATHEVVLELRVHMQHEPAYTAPFIFICPEHTDIKWDDLITEKAWDKICAGFLNVGRAAPKKNMSALIVRPIKGVDHNILKNPEWN